MALPAVRTLADCADFSKTVVPFVPQFRSLSQQIPQALANPQQMRDLYLSTNPLISAFVFSLLLFPIFLLVSEANKNYSQVDRMWSILPTVYNGHYAMWARLHGMPTVRLDTLLVFTAIWSIRLTFNYWRKGGYSKGSEDYRWAYLRSKISPTAFFIFNILFISLAQSVLLFMITAPTYVLLLTSRMYVDGSELTDFVFSRILAGLVLLEWFADQQQWTFQQAKKEYLKTAKVPLGFEQEDLDRGFVITGLWSWSRHPNFAAEQAIWLALYQWSCTVTGTLYNWSIVGALSYVILFQASTWFTESISSGKYPEYAEYQQRVGMFLPRMSTSIREVSGDRARENAARPTADVVKDTATKEKS
ncbi:hypothetical protein GP486_002714 [Trichoglossum hirsutum]|uniref:DUF1295 domain protein n=1 Tax=Trichoglossum hirsutum TaxID=265104 RepID=A0A9P8LEP3_9PEZI|nr:hypothetical protein GP486_002714 [Trichoglossum hirsutum]